MPNVSVPDFPSPTQNLMPYGCSIAAFSAWTESLDWGPLKTRSILNKLSQPTEAWRVLKFRPPILEPARCERAATYSHVREKLFPIFFIQSCIQCTVWIYGYYINCMGGIPYGFYMDGTHMNDIPILCIGRLPVYSLF